MIVLKCVIHRGRGWNAVGLCGKVLVVEGGYRRGSSEKLREASPISDKASASWL